MKPERNAPCPCGSGKKFKKCCQGSPTPPSPSSARLSAPSDSEISELVTLFQSGQLPILEERTRRLLSTYPDSGFLWKALGISLQAQGKNGIPALEKAANYLPQDAETRNNLGNALLESGHPEQASTYYRQALALQPDFAVAHFNLGNRLPLFARKPAPLQISWLGYFATTGLSEMDYVLVDPVGLPAGAEEHFVETPCFLPDSRLCFTPPLDAPPVAPLPALSAGHLTFASFQNLNKLGDDVLTLWRDLMEALPQARLRLQCAQCPEQETVLHERLLRHGFPLERIALHRTASRSEYFRAYAEVDLILDTFPYPGGTTTCEALWMGVPTLTLAGKSLLERQGASLLHAAGLADWIAEDRASYLEKAIAATRNLTALAALRARLREQVQNSALVDAPRFATHFATTLWTLWHHRGAPRVERSLETLTTHAHRQNPDRST